MDRRKFLGSLLIAAPAVSIATSQVLTKTEAQPIKDADAVCTEQSCSFERPCAFHQRYGFQTTTRAYVFAPWRGGPIYK